MGLDRDAALALEVHVVEHLVFHLAFRQSAGQLEQAVGERRLTVIDVSDDREIANSRWMHLDTILVHVLVDVSSRLFRRVYRSDEIGVAQRPSRRGR